VPALAIALAAVTNAASAPTGAPGNCAPIRLDIGHTPKGPGATSARGVGEHSFNRRFVLELKQALSQETRYPVELAYGGREDLGVHRRAQFIKAMTSGILLSIHHDSAQPRYLEPWLHNGRPQRHTDRFSGFSLFVSGQAQSFAESIALAKAIGGRFVAAGASPTLHHSEPPPGENRPLIDAGLGLYRFDELAVLRYAKVPAVLIELGVIVNRRDEEKLNDIAYRRRLQGAIVAALRRFCEPHSARQG
jgi:N-acetylmuramoyl-L-alanine amidase